MNASKWLLSAAAIVALQTPSAMAITNGAPDGDGHPYVGLAVFDVDGQPAWRCSGTLIAPRVFLTAGHCTAGATAARVWFASDMSTNPEYPFSGTTSFDGTPIAHPDYGTGFPNTRDVGVIMLTEDPGITSFGTLPTKGALDDLAKMRGLDGKEFFRAVGYGNNSIVPKFTSYRIRYTATSQLVNLRSALTDGYNVQVSGSPGLGSGTGGTCFGDSGGPVFYPENSNVVAAVVSFGLNSNCVGTSFHYRMDIADSWDWLQQYLPD